MNWAMEANLGMSGHRPRMELDDEDYYPQGGWDTVFLVALLLLGLPANGLMAWLAASQARQGAGTRLALLLLSLALSDLLFLAAAIFQILEIQHGGHWPLGTAACRFYYFLWGVSYSSGLFLLAALSLDRCLLALCPRWYPGHRPARLPLWVCSGVWVLATLFSVPWLVFPEAAVWWYDLVICLDFWDSEELPLRAFEVLGGFLPFLLLFGSHVLTQAAACRTRCCGQRRPQPHACRGFARVAKTILSAYVVLRLPYQLAQLLYLAFLCDLYPGYLLWEALVYSDYLVLLNSCLSPFLCLLASADLRALLHALLASFAAVLCEEQPGTILPAEPQVGRQSSQTPPGPAAEVRPLSDSVSWSLRNSPAQLPVNPTTQAQMNPITQAQMNPTTQAQVSPMTQAQVNLTTQAQVSPMTQAQVNLTTQAQVSPMTHAQVTPMTQAQVTPMTQAQVTPMTQAQSHSAVQPLLCPITQPALNSPCRVNPQPQGNPQSQMNPPTQLESDPMAQPPLSPMAQSWVKCEAQGLDPTERPQTSLEVQARAASAVSRLCAETPPAPAPEPTPESCKSPDPAPEPTPEAPKSPASDPDPTPETQESPVPDPDFTPEAPKSPALEPDPTPEASKSPALDPDPTPEVPDTLETLAVFEETGPVRAPLEAAPGAGPT